MDKLTDAQDLAAGRVEYLLVQVTKLLDTAAEVRRDPPPGFGAFEGRALSIAITHLEDAQFRLRDLCFGPDPRV